MTKEEKAVELKEKKKCFIYFFSVGERSNVANPVFGRGNNMIGFILPTHIAIVSTYCNCTN